MPTVKETQFTNTVPVLEDNEFKYIWLNEEECKNKLHKVMILITLDYVSAISAEDGASYNRPSEKLTELAEKWAKYHMSPNLKSMLVPVNLDNEIAVPIAKEFPTQKTSIKSINDGRVAK